MAEEDVKMASTEVAPTETEKATKPTPEENGAAATSGDETALQRARRQVEFYFADANLPFDKFMWSLHTKDPEHWVPLETVSSFKRMKEFASKGREWLLKALKSSEELEVDSTGTKIRRSTEVQEPKGQMERSVYAKGFPDEDDTLQKRLEDFFANYGPTNQVRMRRADDKSFKNSVFVEFSDYKSVEAFLNADPKPAFEGKSLLIMSKEAYCEMKIKEKGLTGKAAVTKRDNLNKGRFNAFREMEKKPSSANGKKVNKEIYLDFMGTNVLIDGSDGTGKVNADDIPFVKGATLKFDGCGGSVSWNEIKEPIRAKFEKPVYIKYARGDNDGLVGFHHTLTEEQIQSIREAIPQINGNDAVWTVPEEDVERAFQIERAQAAAKSVWEHASGQGSGRSDRGGRGRGRGGRGGGGRGGRGGGRGGNRSGGGRGYQAAKASATEGAGKEAKDSESATTGDKRKRAVEPDGGPDVGVRGNNAPPVIQAAKKAKVDGES